MSAAITIPAATASPCSHTPAPPQLKYWHVSSAAPFGLSHTS
jgi:hypothetical protein